MRSSIAIPAFPRYDDYRDLIPVGDQMEELASVCTRILNQHGPAVDQCHADVRTMLISGHGAGRRWACKKVRAYLTTTGRTQLLEDYYQKLEAARQSALASQLTQHMHLSVQAGLAIEATSSMSYEERVQLREALVAIQKLDNEISMTDRTPTTRDNTRTEHSARPKGPSRPHGRVARGEKALLS